MFILMLT